MTLGLQIVAAWMAFVPLFGLGALVWAAYSGQFDDLQALARAPLDEREPQDWPGRPRPRRRSHHA